MRRLPFLIFTSVISLPLFVGVSFAQVAAPKEGCVIKEKMTAQPWEVRDDPVTASVRNFDDTANTTADVMWLYQGIPAVDGRGALEVYFAEFGAGDNDYVFNKTQPASPLSAAQFDAAVARGELVAGKTEFHLPQFAKADQSALGIKAGEQIPKNWALFCILVTIDTIIDWIFIVLVVAAVGIFAVAGFLWITSGTDPSQQKKAGAMIMAGIIGLILAFLARIIPAVVTSIIS